MKIVEPQVELWKQEPTLEGVWHQIAKATRVCYVEGTEVLTNRGFVEFKDIDNNKDFVLTYNPTINKYEYEKPNSFEQSYDGDIIVGNHKQIKFAVTPNHRMYASTVDKRDYKFIEAHQMIDGVPHSNQKWFRVPKFFIGSCLDRPEYTGILYKKASRTLSRDRDMNLEVTLPIDDNFIKLMGAYVSEGNSYHGEKYQTGSYCQITQNEGSELYNVIIETLSNMNIKYKIYSDPRNHNKKTIKFGNRAWVELFEELFGRYSKNKHLPKWFRCLSMRQSKLLLYILDLGDGANNHFRHENYGSISNTLLNQMQELYILNGKNASITHCDNRNSNYGIVEETESDSWIIKPENLSKEHYNGKVYCTQTNNGIICIRYKGKTCWCGNCYQSKPREGESSEDFVKRIILKPALIEGNLDDLEHCKFDFDKMHGAMLEHGTVYLTNYTIPSYWEIAKLPYTKYNKHNDVLYITTNVRVLFEHNMINRLYYAVEPTKYHLRRYTFSVITDIGVTREMNRHRTFSVAEQSTRYCDLTKNKFGGELTFIKPAWRQKDKNGFILSFDDYDAFLANCEQTYKQLRQQGWRPEQARQVLPLGLKTQAVYTAFSDNWEHFLKLRADNVSGKAHPNMQLIAKKIKEIIETL